MAALWQAFICVVLQLPVLCAGLTCLQCSDIPVPRDCKKVRRCGSHEVCYIDQFVAAAGHIRYDLGCRDAQFCKSNGRRSVETWDIIPEQRNITDDVIVRSAGDVKICNNCCNTDLCNNAGCGATGYPARQVRGPVCYTCAQQRSPETCDAITVCGLNSICKVKLDTHLTTGDVYYTSTCEDPQVCHQDAVFQNMIVGRKRLTEEVDTSSHKCVVKCCDGDLCNGHCGTGGVSGVTSGSSGTNTNPCLSNPCVHGTCSVSQRTYVCTCQNGATGRNCDTLPDPCLNNPCVHGTCHSSGTSYQCHCNSGYTGTNCDHTPDPCSNNPCVHGTCHGHITRYHCVCNSGYTGTNCDQASDPCFNNPCVQGTCHRSGTSYHCVCSSGYTGTNCDHAPPNPCAANPCHNGVCHPAGTTYYCQCYTGYTGQNCDQVADPCAANPCGLHGVCSKSGISFYCSCSAGWSGTYCHQYVGTGTVSHSCSSGWTRHGNSCYLVQKSKATWTQARSACWSQGAYLAEVNDDSEERFLEHEGPEVHKGDWWLGGVNHGGHWRWDHSGSSFGHSYWGHGLPSHDHYYCLEIKKVIKAWNNEDCDHPNYYFCEKSA